MPFKICVIDDDDLFRETLATDLRREGFQVFEAANGVDGLQLILESKSDVAIVDVFMPGIGGAEVLELIRGTAPCVRRIAISGADSRNGDWFVDALGAADAFAPKPINRKRLYGQIRMLLRGS
jgi:two-component system, OmpR family, response regulator RegX3